MTGNSPMADAYCTAIHSAERGTVAIRASSITPSKWREIGQRRVLRDVHVVVVAAEDQAAGEHACIAGVRVALKTAVVAVRSGVVTIAREVPHPDVVVGPHRSCILTVARVVVAAEDLTTRHAVEQQQSVQGADQGRGVGLRNHDRDYA